MSSEGITAADSPGRGSGGGLLRGVRSTVGLARELLRFTAGYAGYVLTGRTPHFGYDGMRQLYCRTNGRSNDVMSRLLAVAHPPRAAHDENGLLGAADAAEVERVVGRLEDRGFHVFASRLPAALCDELERFARETPCRPQAPGASPPPAVRYDGDAPIATKYDFAEAELLEQPVVQRLIADASVLRIAQAYLGAEPILDLVAMWWSTAFAREASSEAAQLYHFDMDRLKFLKFFVYLTDVDERTGPHVYVAGSVRRKPRALLRDGRIPDREVEAHYDARDIVQVTGPRGTVFAADTRGFHKGRALAAGERLLLQLEFTNSLFGQRYERIRLAATEPRLARARQRCPRVYTRLVF